jgi:hypothetical protein
VAPGAAAKAAARATAAKVPAGKVWRRPRRRGRWVVRAARWRAGGTTAKADTETTASTAAAVVGSATGPATAAAEAARAQVKAASTSLRGEEAM